MFPFAVKDFMYAKAPPRQQIEPAVREDYFVLGTIFLKESVGKPSLCWVNADPQF